MVPVKKLSVLFIVVLLFSCSDRPASEPVAIAEKKPAPAAVEKPIVPVSSQPAEPEPSSRILTGTVQEAMSSGGYTYLKVKTGSGDVWVAVPQAKVKKGAKVEVALQMLMENFESPTLGRKFDRLAFATLVSGESAPVPAAAAQHMSVPAPIGTISVEKAEGGKTVAEIWAAKSALGDQTVVVRGKVVKFLPEIMGKNWLHIRDGSGSRKEGDDDITVTTEERAAVGDVVVVSGTLRVDKDFGAGYRDPVIIEEAKLRK